MALKLVLWTLTGIFFMMGYPASEDTGQSIPVVMDTLKSTPRQREVERLQKANYHPLYIGARKDSVVISNRWEHFASHYVYGALRSSFARPDSSGLSITVDTTRIISNCMTAAGNNKQFKQVQFVKAFPVIISNTTSKRLNIGSGYHIPLILEAKDEKGKWRPIEEPFIYTCGTGANAIVLEPEHILVTSAPLNTGPFRTKLRLRFNHILSHEFSGQIHLSQFDSEFSIRH